MLFSLDAQLITTSTGAVHIMFLSTKITAWLNLYHFFAFSNENVKKLTTTQEQNQQHH